MSIAALATADVFAFDFEAALPTGVQIERFLDGTSHGTALLEALYGSVADEPIPGRLLAVVRNGG
ncbi:MAG: hypothetical protein JO010_09400 [Alphaproteobacteria bacterium]|nr:hypothetical protein [Alphaproteobacteria bacterium]